MVFLNILVFLFITIPLSYWVRKSGETLLRHYYYLALPLICIVSALFLSEFYQVISFLLGFLIILCFVYGTSIYGVHFPKVSSASIAISWGISCLFNYMLGDKSIAFNLVLYSFIKMLSIRDHE